MHTFLKTEKKIILDTVYNNQKRQRNQIYRFTLLVYYIYDLFCNKCVCWRDRPLPI